MKGYAATSTLSLRFRCSSTPPALLLALVLWGQRNLSIYWEAGAQRPEKEAPIGVGEVVTILVGLFIWVRTLVTLAALLS